MPIVLLLLLLSPLISYCHCQSVCPPGQIPKIPSDTENSTTESCYCYEGSYRELITCNSTSKQAIVMNGGWIGNYSGEILAGYSVYLYDINTESPQTISYGITLPLNWSNVDYTLCGRIYRTGTLCGKCIEGYAPSTNLFTHYCVKCSKKDVKVNWLWYLLLEYVPLTIMFFVLAVFNIDATSGSGNAFIFYSQMIVSIFDISKNGAIPLNEVTHHKSRIFTSLYSIPYGIWNLEFLSVLFPPFCLSQTLGTYGSILLNYAVALYPILLIFVCCFVVWLYGKGLTIAVLLCHPVYRCILRIQRKWQFSRSMLKVFATFIIMSYTKMLMVSFQLVTPASLANRDSKIVYHNLPAYNGTAQYSDPGMSVMYTCATVFLIVYIVILPVLLMSPSIIKTLHYYTEWAWLTKILPWGRLQLFLENFHSCYVEGSRKGQFDYRWFSGLYLIVRALFFTIVTFAGSTMQAYGLMGSLCFLCMFILSWSRPFKFKHHNILNIGVFCILGIVSFICAYNWYQLFLWHPIPPLLFWFEYILICVPLLIVIISILKKIIQKWKARRNLLTAGNHLQPLETSYSEDVEEDDIKMDDDAFYFLKFTEKSGRLKTYRERTWYVPSLRGHNGSRGAAGIESTIKVDPSTSNSATNDYGTINN